MVDTLKVYSEQGNVKTLKLRDQNTSAYTQTYSTASKTVEDATATAIAAADATITAGTAGYTDTAEATKIVTLVNELKVDYTALLADVLVLRKVITALIDDLQALELVT